MKTAPTLDQWLTRWTLSLVAVSLVIAAMRCERAACRASRPATRAARQSLGS